MWTTGDRPASWCRQAFCRLPEHAHGNVVEMRPMAGVDGHARQAEVELSSVGLA